MNCSLLSDSFLGDQYNLSLGTSSEIAVVSSPTILQKPSGHHYSRKTRATLIHLCVLDLEVMLDLVYQPMCQD